MSIRAKALRQRVWYKTLDSLERGIVNLTIGIVERVKSLSLTKVLEAIHEKLEDACMSVYDRHHKARADSGAFLLLTHAHGTVHLTTILI